MKKRSIGEITQGGGFPAAIRDVRETGEPLFITKGNEVVASLSPCNDAVMGISGDMIAMGKVIALLAKQSDAAVHMYLIQQFLIGYMAKTLLIGIGAAQVIAELESDLAAKFAVGMQRDRTGDKATLGSDLSTVPVEGKSRRRKSAASPKPSPPRKSDKSP